MIKFLFLYVGHTHKVTAKIGPYLNESENHMNESENFY